MFLARRYHFSTWRYGGWGMYAAPDGSDRDVYVFVSSCGPSGAPLSPEAAIGDRTTGYFYLVHDARLDLLSLPGLDAAQKRELSRRIRDVRSLARPDDFRRLAQWIDAHEALTSSGPLGILIAEPHIDMRGGRAYADVFGAVREGGRWSAVEPTRAEAAMDVILARIGACP